MVRAHFVLVATDILDAPAIKIILCHDPVIEEIGSRETAGIVCFSTKGFSSFGKDVRIIAIETEKTYFLSSTLVYYCARDQGIRLAT